MIDVAAAFQQATKLHQSNQLEQAAGLYRLVVRNESRFAEAWNNLGVIHRDQRKLLSALHCFRRAVALQPGIAAFQMNLGDIFANLRLMNEAEVHLRKSVELDPTLTAGWYQLANILMTRGQFEEGHAMIDRALQLDPSSIGIRWTKAFGFLMAGEYERGFREWECRLDLLNLTRPDIPLWHGEDLSGKTLLVYGEQGLGDVLQFVRYLKGLPKSTGTVLFETPIELRELLEGSLAHWKNAPKFEFRNHGSKTALHADFQVSLLSLPNLVGTVSAEPYLFGNGDSFELPNPSGAKLKVGICWAGSPTHKYDHDRSATLPEFFRELSMPNVEIYSLQVSPGGRREDPSLIGPDGWIYDLGSTFKSFTDTANAILNLDRVVTVDTSVAHLAGALGAKTYLLLPFHGLDWRWGLRGSSTIWYPSTQLHRRLETDGDWTRALSEICEDLQNS